MNNCSLSDNKCTVIGWGLNSLAIEFSTAGLLNNLRNIEEKKLVGALKIKTSRDAMHRVLT
jgi:hypothetical protein